MIELRTLGTLGLRDTTSGRELHTVIAQPKRVALLAYLAIATPRGFHRRDTLLGVFWPDSTESRARAALSQAVYILRRTLGENVIATRGDEELAIGGDALWCDAVAFDELIASGEHAKALGLYGGDLLRGFFLSECMEFEQWLHAERTGLRDRAVRAAWRLADEHGAAGNEVEAAHWARRAVSFTPEDEPSVRRLVTLLANAGDRAGALRELDAFSQRMRELELDLSRETMELGERVRGDTRSRGPAAKAQAVAPTHEAPAERTPVPAPVPTDAGPRPPPSRRTSRALLAAAGAIVLTVGIAAVWVARNDDQPLYSDKRVLVAEFTNETGDRSFDALGRATADWLAQGLSRTGLVEVVPSVTAMRSAQAMEVAGEAPPAIIARSLAEETGAGIVVSGAYYKEGDTLIFHARITDGRTGRVLRGIEPVKGSAREPMTTVDVLRRRMLGSLASLTDSRLTTWGSAASQPPSFEAYQLYAEALDEFFRGEPEGYRRSAVRFREAAELHPDFTAPTIWAVFAHMNLNEWASADSLVRQMSATRESLPAWDRAVLAYQDAQIRGASAPAYTAARRVVELAPQSEWQFLQSSSAFAVNRPREAVSGYTRMDPDHGWIRQWSGYWTGLASAQHFVGQYRAELETLRRGRARYPENRQLQLFEVRGLAAAGAVQEAFALAESIPRAGTDPYASLDAFNMLARELRVHGDSATSLRAAERGIARLAPPAGSTDLRWRFTYSMLLAYAERWSDAYELARPLPVPGPSATNLGMRGITAARTSRRDEALAAADELARLELPYSRGAPKLWAAGIYAHLGDRERAMQLLRTAVGEGLPFDGRGIHGHIGVLPLRGYRPFEELVRPKG